MRLKRFWSPHREAKISLERFRLWTLRKVTEKDGSIGSESGNDKRSDDSEEEVLPVVGMTTSGRNKDDLKGMLKFLSLNQSSWVRVKKMRGSQEILFWEILDGHSVWVVTKSKKRKKNVLEISNYSNFYFFLTLLFSMQRGCWYGD